MEKVLNLFDDNYQAIQNYASWTVEKRIILRVASYYTARGERFEAENFQQVIEAIKQQTSWLSSIRSSQLLQYTYAMIFANEENKEQAIRLTLQNKKALREAKFPNSSFNYIAALFIDKEHPKEHAKVARTLYDEIRKHHKFLTSYDDIPITVILTKDKPNDLVVRAQTMRRYYDELRKNKFYQGNELQALSQILTIPNALYLEQIVPYVLRIRDELQKHGIKTKQTNYIQLGILAIVGIGQEKLEELVALYQILVKDKKFKWYKDEALIVAVQQILPTINREKLELLSIVTLEMIIQLQHALIATTAIASSAAASSGGGD